jgi:hypothetical protein
MSTLTLDHNLVAPDAPHDPVTRTSGLAQMMSRLAVGEEYLWQPDRVVAFEHWLGHIPFLFWLMKVLKPRCYVELGTHRGNSFCAMGQAVDTLQLDAVGYAVDTWHGDVHMAFEAGLLDELRAYHDPRYGRFSTLLPMTFDQARQNFADGSIDLLHIDGTHTYDQVRHDFELWRPTLSHRSVVLFHDVNVRGNDFGVWRLWQELSLLYPAFTFHHSHGLGVLGVGADLPTPLGHLFAMAADSRNVTNLRHLFATRGDGLVDRFRAAEAEARTRSLLAEAEARAAAELVAVNAAAEQRLGEAEARREALAALRDAAEERVNETEARVAIETAAVRAEADQRVAAAESRIAAELTMLRAKAHQRDWAAQGQAAAELATATAKAQQEIALRARAEAELSVARADAARWAAKLKAAGAEADRRESSSRAQLLAAEAQIARLQAIEDSTTWQMSRPLRITMGAFPSGLRRRARRLLRSRAVS